MREVARGRGAGERGGRRLRGRRRVFLVLVQNDGGSLRRELLLGVGGGAQGKVLERGRVGELASWGERCVGERERRKEVARKERRRRLRGRRFFLFFFLVVAL